MILDAVRVRRDLDALALDSDLRDTLDKMIEDSGELARLRCEYDKLEAELQDASDRLERAREIYIEVRQSWKGPWPDKWKKRTNCSSTSPSAP